MKFSQAINELATAVELAGNTAKFYEVVDGRPVQIPLAQVPPQFQAVVKEIAAKLKKDNEYAKFAPENLKDLDIKRRADGSFDITSDAGEKYIYKV